MGCEAVRPLLGAWLRNRTVGALAGVAGLARRYLRTPGSHAGFVLSFLRVEFGLVLGLLSFHPRIMVSHLPGAIVGGFVLGAS